MDQPERIVVVLRVSDAAPDHIVVGSVERACSRCRATVYVSPSSATFLAQGALLVCVPCAVTAASGGERIRVQPLTASQVVELRTHLHPRAQG